MMSRRRTQTRSSSGSQETAQEETQRYDYYYFKRYVKFIKEQFDVTDPYERTSKTPQIILAFLKWHCDNEQEGGRGLSYNTATALCSSIAFEFSKQHGCLRQRYEIGPDGEYQGSPTCHNDVTSYMALLRQKKKTQKQSPSKKQISVIKKAQKSIRIKSTPVRSLTQIEPIHIATCCDVLDLYDTSHYAIYVVAFLFCLTLKEAVNLKSTDVEITKESITLNFNRKVRMVNGCCLLLFVDQFWPEGVTLNDVTGCLPGNFTTKSFRNGGCVHHFRRWNAEKVIQWACHDEFTPKQVADVLLNYKQ